MGPSPLLRRALTLLALGLFLWALLLPTVTAVAGHDASCAEGCAGGCEPGCLGCGCLDRGLIALAPAVVLPTRTLGAAPMALLEGERPAERSTPPPYRPPRS